MFIYKSVMVVRRIARRGRSRTFFAGRPRWVADLEVVRCGGCCSRPGLPAGPRISTAAVETSFCRWKNSKILPAARSLTARFRRDYNERRPHSSLYDIPPPNDFATQWPASTQSAALPSLQHATATTQTQRPCPKSAFAEVVTQRCRRLVGRRRCGRGGRSGREFRSAG